MLFPPSYVEIHIVKWMNNNSPIDSNTSAGVMEVSENSFERQWKYDKNAHYRQCNLIYSWKGFLSIKILKALTPSIHRRMSALQMMQ